MRTRKPPRSKERYILDSIPSIFKGGEWLEPGAENSPSAGENRSSQKGGEGVSALENRSSLPAGQDSMSTRYMTIIGGQKYDHDAVKVYLDRVRWDIPFVVGSGRGIEQMRYEAKEYIEIPLDPDRYGKNARKVNVECVLSFAPESPLVLVGEGERVKQARAWLKRARWPREVIELP